MKIDASAPNGVELGIFDPHRAEIVPIPSTTCPAEKLLDDLRDLLPSAPHRHLKIIPR